MESNPSCYSSSEGLDVVNHVSRVATVPGVRDALSRGGKYRQTTIVRQLGNPLNGSYPHHWFTSIFFSIYTTIERNIYQAHRYIEWVRSRVRAVVMRT